MNRLISNYFSGKVALFIWWEKLRQMSTKLNHMAFTHWVDNHGLIFYYLLQAIISAIISISKEMIVTFPFPTETKNFDVDIAS